MVYGLVSLSLLAGTVVATVTFGGVTGTEFCPATFESRDFSYHELPLVGWQVTGIRRSQPEPVVLAPVLMAKKWIAPTLETAPRWDLIEGQRGHFHSPAGDASILMAYLESVNEHGSSLWLMWSDSHPASAAQLWPLVADAARREAYLVLPDLFDAAKEFEARPATEFGLRLKSVAALGYRRFSLGLQQQGRTAEAQDAAATAEMWENEVGGRF